MPLSLTSSAFQDGQSIPVRFTCSGDDTSPALDWKGVPSQARSLALIVDDPDAPAGTWVHWVIFNIPIAASGLPESVPARKELADGSRQGLNDFRKVGYGGPCPPPGNAHRYFFKLYALDLWLDLAAGATKAGLERAMSGHVLAETRLIGSFKR